MVSASLGFCQAAVVFSVLEGESGFCSVRRASVILSTRRATSVEGMEGGSGQVRSWNSRREPPKFSFPSPSDPPPINSQHACPPWSEAPIGRNMCVSVFSLQRMRRGGSKVMIGHVRGKGVSNEQNKYSTQVVKYIALTTFQLMSLEAPL
jgi:hypothetical protein